MGLVPMKERILVLHAFFKHVTKKERSIEMLLRYYNESGKPINYHHKGDAGLDLPIHDERLWTGEISTDGKVVLEPMGQITLKTGVHLAIPEGNFGLLDSRSGTSKKRLDLLCRTIDQPYRGNIRLAIINLNTEPVTISDGDELFQIVIMPYTEVHPIGFRNYETFMLQAGETTRGAEGFGSKERNNKKEGK